MKPPKSTQRPTVPVNVCAEEQLRIVKNEAPEIDEYKGILERWKTCEPIYDAEKIRLVLNILGSNFPPVKILESIMDRSLMVSAVHHPPNWSLDIHNRAFNKMIGLEELRGH